MIGERIRHTRQARRLSLNDVAGRAKVSVATLSRIEREKQGLELGLFLTLRKILKAAPHELLDGEGGDHIDPLAVRIADLDHAERLRLWRDLAATRRDTRRNASHAQLARVADEVEVLLAQLEYVRAEVEAVHGRIRRR